jgi:hypothetical protein
MAAQSILSQRTLEEAHAMALLNHTWSTGRSKRDGRAFFVIPSRSEPSKAHYTTAYGCTCKGARRNGDCAHQEAVRMREARERATVPTTKRYEDLFPADDLEDAF